MLNLMNFQSRHRGIEGNMIQYIHEKTPTLRCEAGFELANKLGKSQVQIRYSRDLEFRPQLHDTRFASHRSDIKF
jgi:hypothetical protein